MNARVPQVSYEPVDQLASLCKAAGDPLRLHILRVLSNDSFGVLELSHLFAVPQSGMSHHLKVLAQAGLVASRREGNAIFYRRALPHNEAPKSFLHAALLESLESLSLSEALQQRLANIHAQRCSVSEDFFTRMAGSLQRRQDLIAGLPQYRDSLLSLLDALVLPTEAQVIEIGPGEGQFLPDLALRFQQVTALDNNPAMLELARHHCAQLQLPNIHWMLDDVLKPQGPQADCIILNMVLHHLATPAKAFEHLAQRLHPNGSLLITELCQHQQNWAKEVCGDLWLGFEHEELTRWANRAGLQAGESLYLGLKNGFQIQIRHFAKSP